MVSFVISQGCSVIARPAVATADADEPIHLDCTAPSSSFCTSDDGKGCAWNVVDATSCFGLPQAGAALSFAMPGNRKRRTPFASVTSGSMDVKISAMPLFSLASALQSASGSRQAGNYDTGYGGYGPSRAHATQQHSNGDGDADEETADSDRGMDVGGEEDESSGSGSSPEQPSSELGDTEMEQLSSVRCSSCHTPLLRRRRDAQDLRVCDGCHRCFHRSCCRRAHLGMRGGQGSDLWFHRPECQQSHQAIRELCQAGAVELPDGWSLQLVDPEEAGSTSSPNHKQLEDVVSVLGDAYGPFVFQQVEASDFGVLVRSKHAAAAAAAAAAGSISRSSGPSSSSLKLEQLAEGPQADGSVSAATLDVYGLEMAKVDLLATREDVRGQGHCRALVSGLEDVLSGLGIQSLVVVLDREDRESADMWMKHFVGYKRLNGRQSGALRNEFPHFQAYDRKASVFLRRQLRESEQGKSRGEAAAVGSGASDGAVKRWPGRAWHAVHTAVFRRLW